MLQLFIDKYWYEAAGAEMPKSKKFPDSKSKLMN